MTAIMLTRIYNQCNMAWFYKIDVQPMLFGERSVVREWGRIGRAGAETRGAADIALIDKWSEKPKRGYRKSETLVRC